jgi:hypothetical protein
VFGWLKRPSTRNTTLTSVGFIVPSDFPSEAYERIHGRLVKYKDTNRVQWHSFSLGWNGLAYRYRAMAEYDEQYSSLIRTFGNSPPSEGRYKQGKALFGFFVTAVSTIECFFYSAYWVGAILEPGTFPSDAKAIKLYPLDIAKKFEATFPGDSFSKQMTQCVCESTYAEMKDIRDVLSHRGMLPRRFYRGGERNGMATMPVNPKDLSDQWQYELSIDERTTATRRQWLSGELEHLTSAANDFCERRL